MIDKDFLQGCTDEQINKGVAWLEAKKAIINSYGNWWHSVGEPNIIYKGSFSNHFQPCTNPNYAWPIILESKISLLVDYKTWEASIDFCGNESEHGTDELLSKVATGENPLRAAMEVYLLMSNKS